MKLEQKALYLNIIVNLFVSFLKIIGGILGNAFTLMIDGIYTISDLVTDVIALFGIKIGRRRANKNHPYGYGRVFYVIELFMGVLALLVGIFVIYLSFKIDYQKPPLGITSAKGVLGSTSYRFPSWHSMAAMRKAFIDIKAVVPSNLNTRIPRSIEVDLPPYLNT